MGRRMCRPTRWLTSTATEMKEENSNRAWSEQLVVRCSCHPNKLFLWFFFACSVKEPKKIPSVRDQLNRIVGLHVGMSVSRIVHSSREE